MGIGKNLKNEIQEWGILVITTVILSVIVIKFKDVSGVSSDLNATIDTYVTAFSEPKNWIIIVIIALIGFAVMKIWKGKK